MVSHGHEQVVVIERSRDYLQIPAYRATSDTWPIWRDKYAADHSLAMSLIPPGGPNSLDRMGDGGN
jgi:hypothetical protein